MKLLSVSAFFNRIHHDILCCHEGKLCQHVFLDNLGINHEAVNYVEAQVKNTVCCKEALGY